MTTPIQKALEHYEIATSHLGLALHLFTEHANETVADRRLLVLATHCAVFMGGAQALLKELCDEGVYQMPPEALSVLANADPRSFFEVSAQVRKETGKDAD